MDLIIGGAYQGKLTLAAREYGLTPVLYAMEPARDRAALNAVAAQLRCPYLLLEAGSNGESYLPLLTAAEVVIAREIGSGVVPMDAGERAWRERHGRLLRRLAQQAGSVRRVFCGLTEVLK